MRAIGCTFVCVLHLLGVISRVSERERERETERESVTEKCERGVKVNEKDGNLKRNRGNKKILEEDSSGPQSNILTCLIEVNG